MSTVRDTYAHACSYYSNVTDKRLFWELMKMENRSATIAFFKSKAKCISIYTLSDLGVLSNLIGSLSLANEHYSPPTE